MLRNILTSTNLLEFISTTPMPLENVTNAVQLRILIFKKIQLMYPTAVYYRVSKLRENIDFFIAH